MESNRHITDSVNEPPVLSVFAPCPKETPICLVTAASCWQLLHSNEILQIDFSQLLMSVPLSNWINRFLLDLSFYVGRTEEAHNLVKETKISNIEKNLRLLSLSIMQPQFNVIFQYAADIGKIKLINVLFFLDSSF